MSVCDDVEAYNCLKIKSWGNLLWETWIIKKIRINVNLCSKVKESLNFKGVVNLTK